MKKGFTLIELLAVILILGIIALIAIPTVNNILKEARMGAFSSTLTNIEKAIENECNLSQIKNQNINNVYTISNGKISPNVDIKGNLPDGTIYANKNCEIAYTLFNNNLTGNKEIGEAPIIDDKKSNGIYKENILNGTDPILSDNLIPVRIEKDGTVFKADLNSKWYSYKEKKWANAVILTDTGKIEDNGMILEDSIESYFVWIPRYKYKLFDMGNYVGAKNETHSISSFNEIEIKFENKNNKVSNGNSVGEYYTHPAFQSFDTNGLWIAKFETSGTSNKIESKPNKQTLRYLNAREMFEAGYKYKKNNKSHMMKNTEWGAVAYLSYSKYGINKEININNNSDFMTGYSAANGTNQVGYPGTYGTSSDVTLPYNTETGYLATTTGNIYGIYDMSGGTYEAMAAYTNKNLEISGFTRNPISIYGAKYFDIYEASVNSYASYDKRILGDATGELGPFYHLCSNITRYHNGFFEDQSFFITSDHPWFCRGNQYNDGALAGQFSFDVFDGKEANHITFRIVLAN